jgi:hypothetical protein
LGDNKNAEVTVAGAGAGGTPGLGGSAGGDAGGVDKAHPFSSTSVWNTPTPAGTQWFDTNVLHQCNVSGCADDGLRHWWLGTDFGIVWSQPSDPLWTFDLPAYSGDEWHRTRATTTLQMRAPSTLTPWPPDSAVLVVADQATGDYIEIWQVSVDAPSMTVTGQVWATGNMITGMGAGDAAMNLNGGVHASNFSYAAGTITQADLDSGKIDHALLIGLPYDMLAGGNPPTGPYRAPATCGSGTAPTGPIVMGSKIGVPPGTPMPAGLSSTGILVFDALQTYGAFVGDGVGDTAIVLGADGPSMGLARGTSIESTLFDPLIAYWNHGGSSDMEKIGPLLRVADYQP